MLTELTIPKIQPDPALDPSALYAAGLDHVRALARRIWTDYNVHDPGITTLELLCYALTDLGYRASFPVEDLLAVPDDNALSMAGQFFTARQILTSRPVTAADYRKLLIDLVGVRNAWIQPSPLTYYVDPTKETLLHDNPGTPGIRAVNVRGLYDARIDFMPSVDSDAARDAVLAAARERLHANRSLAEDFVSVTGVETRPFVLCAEMELEPDADVSRIKADILFQVEEYLAPPVGQYTLSAMLARPTPDGPLYTAPEIFGGPVLEHGFIDDAELANADLRSEIRLSDVISIVMDIEGVRAVRDMVIQPEGDEGPLANRWVVPVDPAHPDQATVKATLNRALSRIVFYKRNLPIAADPAAVDARYAELRAAAQAQVETPLADAEADFPIPLGRYRDLGAYFSVQNHFPVTYGIAPEGLGSAATDKRRALAYQLKAYLLFFDQLMANYFAQLAHVRELFSTDPDETASYFAQPVTSFADFDKIYGVPDIQAMLDTELSDAATVADRRQRFLDHLVVRFAERFHELAHIRTSAFGATPEALRRETCEFLQDVAALGSERGLAYNYTLAAPGDLWDTENVSGLERRVARLLGMDSSDRRTLSVGDVEGMHLVENILLRPKEDADPFLPVCVDPNCTDCAEDDPYSYRLHILLPAYAGRFTSIDFRRFAEQVIREETPAHLLPKICWISREDMTTFEARYRDWLELVAGVTSVDRAQKIQDFIDILYAVKSVYPSQKLHECDSLPSQSKFILGQTALGSESE